MKTRQNITSWPGVVLACGIIAFVVPVEATEPAPAYWVVAVEGDIKGASISDSGVLFGQAFCEYGVGGSVRAPAVLPPRIIDGEVHYLAGDLQCLPDIDGYNQLGDCFGMNAMGLAAGYVDDIGPERAILWLADGTAVDLGVAPLGVGSAAMDVNDAGSVLVAMGYENEPGEGGGVVVPLDLDADGEPDTWFTDNDADGMNDLYFPTDVGHNLLPMVINEAGQELVAQIVGGERVGFYLLTPDFNDADGDGNPWFADENGDGFNDLFVALEPPEPGASFAVVDLNNLGQIVGQSGSHVFRWEFVDGVQIVTDVGFLSDKLVMSAAGISDSGRIVGVSTRPIGWAGKPGPSWLIESDTLYELFPLLVNWDGSSELRSGGGINNLDWICGSGWVGVPILPTPPPVCGDGACDPGEDECNCPADCGTPPTSETDCTDDVDTDCDGLVDCDDTDDCAGDPSCACGAKGDSCTLNSDCCSDHCKPNGTCR